MDTLIDRYLPLGPNDSLTEGELPQEPQPKICISKPNSRKSGEVVPLYPGPVVAGDEISARAKKAIGILRKEYVAVAHDPRQAKTLRHATVEIFSRPQGLPDHPPVWWRDRKPGQTPPAFILEHYKGYLGKGLTAGFFQREGQDKALYNALLKWLKIPGNELPADLDLPKKLERLDRRYEETGGVFKDGAALSLTEARQGARLYQEMRRRLG